MIRKQYTHSEMVAHTLLTKGLAPTTSTSLEAIVNSADRIIELAERIKSERQNGIRNMLEELLSKSSEETCCENQDVQTFDNEVVKNTKVCMNCGRIQ